MSIFDLLFIGAFLAMVGAVSTAVVFAIGGQGARAIRVLRGLGIGMAAYFGMVILVSLVAPQRVLEVGDPECFDDWCVTVEAVERTPAGTNVGYSVALRLSSRARRVAQRENNLSVYLTDHRGRRYDPVPDKSAVPFNVLLQPQESVPVTRVFAVPPDAHELGLVIAHEGGFPIGWFIIGYDTWFRKPTVVRFRQ